MIDRRLTSLLLVLSFVCVCCCCFFSFDTMINILFHLAFRFLGVKGQSSIHLKPPDYVLTKYYRLMPHLETLKPYQPYHRDASSHKKIAAVLCELRCLDGTLVRKMNSIHTFQRYVILVNFMTSCS